MSHDCYFVGEFASVLNIPVCVCLIALCLASWYPRAVDSTQMHILTVVTVVLIGAGSLHSTIAARPFPKSLEVPKPVSTAASPRDTVMCTGQAFILGDQIFQRITFDIFSSDQDYSL